MADLPLAAPVEADASLHRLAPAVRMVWRLGAVLWWLFLTGAAAVALIATDLPGEWALAMAAIRVAYVLVVPGKRYLHYGYSVSDVELRIVRGWMWRSTSVVLHSRVQHVDTRQGPVERLLGLATVVVFTAGTVGAMVAIPGLPADDADALRDRLVALSGADDAV
jgi:uncharacterized protein